MNSSLLQIACVWAGTFQTIPTRLNDRLTLSGAILCSVRQTQGLHARGMAAHCDSVLPASAFLCHLTSLNMASGLRAHLHRHHLHVEGAQDARQANMHLESTTHIDDTDSKQALAVGLHSAMKMVMQISMCIELLIKMQRHTICFLAANLHLNHCLSTQAGLVSNAVMQTRVILDCCEPYKKHSRPKISSTTCIIG